MSDHAIKRVVVVGGGSAGWLTAGLIASEHNAKSSSGVQVTVIESPKISPLGVGEGTWPSMRMTLSKIGVSETDFIRECDVSFKQGIKFVGWVTGEEGDYYYHPLELPRGFNQIDLVRPWQKIRKEISFADAICFQNALCERGLAPKQLATPEYAAVANYAYHFSSVKLGQFLAKHCAENLGVKHIVDDVTEVKSTERGDISSLSTTYNGDVEGDLFVDCTGNKALLLGEHYGIPYVSKSHIIFNDTALAVQVPYPSPDSPIASHTIATAQSSGWIWDIGLPSRRGVGYVYSSAYADDDSVEKRLRNYLSQSVESKVIDDLVFRKISYQTGHRSEFWHRNCVAVGMSAGFVEPLEATALVMIEASARMISDELPANRDVMDIVAKRFNDRISYYWKTTIDFIKLQYVLTKRRDTAYWRDSVREDSVPDSLKELLRLWRRQVPNKYDFPLAEEMLPAASWQYILYGMGFITENRETGTRSDLQNDFDYYVKEVREIALRYSKHLPSNRELIRKVHQIGLPKV
ncbi:tryptophan halogenase family protein [Marinimicrobium koreense]|jgi:hypothetical protein|uniref:tryptophan halogenase family protein n=1 Tax=Marinimicrobium koreense TaxID=306545 RepID=UPI003F71ED41